MRYAHSPVNMDKGDLYTVADLSLADEGALRVDWALKNASFGCIEGSG